MSLHAMLKSTFAQQPAIVKASAANFDITSNHSTHHHTNVTQPFGKRMIHQLEPRPVYQQQSHGGPPPRSYVNKRMDDANIDDIPEEDLGLGRGAKKRGDRGSRFKGADVEGLLPDSVELRRNWTASLNKLSIETFERIVSQLIELLQHVPTADDLVFIAKSVFEKSISEIQHYAELYGDLVNVLTATSPVFIHESYVSVLDNSIREYMDGVAKIEADYGSCQDSDDKKSNKFKKAKKVELKGLWVKKKNTVNSERVTEFRTKFVDLTQEAVSQLSMTTFDDFTDQEKARCGDDEVEMEAVRDQKRNRLTNTLKFFGELFIRDIVSRKLFINIMEAEVLNFAFTGLVENKESESFRIVAFCQLLEQVGAELDDKNSKVNKSFNVWMEMLEKLMTLDSCDQHAQYKIQDSLDLRKNEWMKKASVMKTLQPKSMAVARHDAKRELAKKDHRFARENGFALEDEDEEEVHISGKESQHPYKEFYHATLARYSSNLNVLEKLAILRSDDEKRMEEAGLKPIMFRVISEKEEESKPRVEEAKVETNEEAK
eukprot:GHVH01005079.1.p1 GENE.GHVH01005079.1~~GHVH01005079.1.p1  ORF type:complete len:545 (+),score=113.14 GHVH01005079.1:161-1795(+)